MIPVNKPSIGQEEKDEVLRVLDEGALTSPSRDGGKRVREFESLLKDYLGARHVVAVNSGTAALQAALMAAGVGRGDEVLLPSFTFVATANAIVATGAKPVFVDIKKDDFTIDPIELESKVTTKTKAIVPVHLYGHPCDMREISLIASRNSLVIIEDACQSLGSTCDRKQTGTLGSMGCFSLYASKVLTSGEGGAIATNDDKFADMLRMIRNHGMVEGYDTRVLGLNLRMPEVCAAIAKVQMKKLPQMLERRRRNALMLTDLLSPELDQNNLVSLPVESNQEIYNWYLYTIAVRDRDFVKMKLTSEQVGAAIYYNPPVHRTPYYETNYKTNLPRTDWAAKHVLSLPVHPFVTGTDIQTIAGTVKSALHALPAYNL